MSARSEKLLDLIDEHDRSNVGYDQGQRWTWLNKAARSIVRGREGDCSSVTIGLIWLAGYPVDSKWIAGSLSAYTGNAYEIITAAGLKPRKVSGLTPAQIDAITKPGDSLLKSGHIMIKARSGKWYTMTSDENRRLVGGAAGDQSGRESVMSNLWADSWTWAFILPDHGGESGPAEPAPNAQQPAPTPAPGLTGGVTLVDNAQTNVRSGPSTSYSVVGTLGPNTQVTGVLVGTWIKIVTPAQYVDQYVSGAVLYDLKTSPAVVDGRPDVSTIGQATDPLLTTNPVDVLNVSEEFAAALTARWAHRVSFASLWHGGNLIVDELPIVAEQSKISVGSNGDAIRRRADLTFSEERWQRQGLVRDWLSLPGVTIRVETGFDLGGRIETVPVFESSTGFSVNTVDGSGVVKVDAPDRMEMVSAYGFPGPMFSNTECTFQDMILAVIQEVSPGARLVDLTGSTEKMPDLYWPAGRNGRIDAVKGLADALGAELFKSPAPGVWVLRPLVAPGETTPKWHINAGRHLVASSRTIDKGRICNHVVVESERADAPKARGEWKDIDPDSSTRYDSTTGPRMAEVVRTSMWTEEDDLKAYAAAIGARIKGSLLDLDWSMLINPLMEAGDAVEITTPDFTYSCVIDSFEIPLGSQRVSAGKARALKVPGVGDAA